MKKEKGELRIKKSTISLAALLVLALPTVLFLAGWLVWYFAIPVTACVLVALWFAAKEFRKESAGDLGGAYVEFKLRTVLIILGLVCGWVYLSGIGGYFPQNSDFSARNPLLRDLIVQDWPVVYNATNNALCYYIGYFLPAGLFGKAFYAAGGETAGWIAGNAFLYFWTVISLMTLFALMAARLKIRNIKAALVVIAVFILFSGADIIEYLSGVVMGIHSTLSLHIEWGYNFGVINGNSIQLFYVFNQAVPAWIAAMLFLTQKNPKIYVLIAGLLLINSPLPMMGLAVLMAVMGIKYLIEKGDAAATKLKNIFSIPNILTILSIVPVFYLYYKGNDSLKISIVDPFAMFGVVNGIVVVVLVCLLNFVFYAFCIYKKHKKNVLFYASLIWLVICLFIRVGDGLDFTMRAAIPAYFIIGYYVCEYMHTHLGKEKKKPNAFFVIIILLSIGSISLLLNITENSITAAQKKTPLVPTLYVYTFEDKQTNRDYHFLSNYVKDNPQEDFFFNTLSAAKDRLQPQIPIVDFDAYVICEDTANEDGTLGKAVSYASGLVADASTLEEALSTVTGDQEYIEKQVQKVWKSEGYFRVEFEEGKVIPARRWLIDPDNFDVELCWENPALQEYANKAPMVLLVRLENNSGQILPGSAYAGVDYLSGVSIHWLDKQGNVVMSNAGYTYTSNPVFPGQTRQYVILAEKPNEKGEYRLSLDFFQDGNFVLSDIYGQRYMYDVTIK